MTTPDIYQDEESGTYDVFVPPTETGALIEFLRGKVPYFGVTIEAPEEDDVETDDGEGADDLGEDEVLDDEPVDAFTFPPEIDAEQLAGLLEEFFSAR